MGFTSEKYEEEMAAIEELQQMEINAGGMPWQLTKMEIWASYTDELLYELEKKVREFIKRTTAGRKYHNGQTIVVSQLFQYIYGRKAEPKDSKINRKLHEIMRYYAMKRTGPTTWRGKRVDSGVYKMSPSAGKRVPYSIRLRMEQFEENGKDLRQFTQNLKEADNWQLGPRQIFGSVKKYYERNKMDANKSGYGKRKKNWEAKSYRKNPGDDPGPADRVDVPEPPAGGSGTVSGEREEL